MSQVKAILIGAGLRGSEAYASYALSCPNELKIVAVAEPDEERRRLFAEKHRIPEAYQFADYKELLERDKIADCALVCTQDTMHFEPVVKALEKGYHVLCEKPMSVSKKEIVRMGMMAGQYGRILSICHVLRYSPFFVKIKELLDEGRIGRLMSIHHSESVGYWHHAHSFVRGNWRNAAKSSPMILAKCCHDMDILLWLAESPCKSVSSFGELTYFKEENAPADAPLYCMDGCRHRDTCPFYAPRFYLEHPRAVKDNLVKAVSSHTGTEKVLEALSRGPYGRCVFRCDNTVVDHQVVSLEFENQVNVSFSMCAFTEECRRDINLMGTKGQITGDMEHNHIHLYDFVTGHEEVIKLHIPSGGHSGSDARMMRDFVQNVAEERENRTAADISVESHLMSLAAEESRVTRQTIDFAQYRKQALGE